MSYPSRAVKLLKGSVCWLLVLVFSYKQRLISLHNFNRRLLFSVSKKWLRFKTVFPKSSSSWRKPLPLGSWDSILNTPVSIQSWSVSVLHLRLWVHCWTMPVNGWINFLNTVFGVGFFVCIQKKFTTPTSMSSFCCYLFQYFQHFIVKLTIRRPPQPNTSKNGSAFL